MKQKRLSGFVLLAVLLCSFAFLFPASAHAKTTIWNMKGIRRDMSPGKTLTYYSQAGGVGLLKQKLKMTVINSKYLPNGNVQLAVQVDFKRTVKLTKSQKKKMISYHMKHLKNDYIANPWIVIVDKNTGKSLLKENNHGVYVGTVNWLHRNETFYGFYVYDMSVDFTVSFPPSYKGLCIGAGGLVTYKESAVDKQFIEGKVPFWKTKKYYSKKQPLAAHFVNPKLN